MDQTRVALSTCCISSESYNTILTSGLECTLISDVTKILTQSVTSVSFFKILVQPEKSNSIWPFGDSDIKAPKNGIPNLYNNLPHRVADLFLFCYERDFMMSLSDDKQADVIDAFNTTSRYLDDILNINNVYFENMVSQIYPSELQLNKANASDTEAAFLDLHLSISNDIVSTKIYDKRDDFDFEIVNFPFLDGDVPRSTSYGVYISQLIRFARASSYVTDFNTRNKLLTQKLLKQGYRYHKLRKTFSKFYRRYYDLISKFQVDLNLSCAKDFRNLISMVTWCIS